MVSTLRQELPTSRNRGGQPKLSIEDQLLITLEYWREINFVHLIFLRCRVLNVCCELFLHLALCVCLCRDCGHTQAEASYE